MKSPQTIGFTAVFFCIVLATNAQAIDYQVTLDAAQEVPTPTLGGATPTGSATVSVNTITGAVSISSGSYTGLTSDASLAHLHGLAPAGSTAGVIFGLSVTGGTAGTISGSGSLGASDLSGLLAGQTYINLHTVNNGPGEIRGQVVDPDILVVNVTLDPDQEIPTPNLGGATPSGTAQIVVDTGTGDIEILGSYDGLTSEITGAHLHGPADASSTAGVIFALTTTGGQSGMFSGTSVLSNSDLNAFLAGNTYLNVHTSTNGLGEIRGQAVPEPSALLYLLLCLTGTAGVRRYAFGYGADLA